jgi:hypothetical protein
MMINQQHVGGQNATSPHAAQQHQQNHPPMVEGTQPGQQMMMQTNRNIFVSQRAQFQQVRQQPTTKSTDANARKSIRHLLPHASN